MAQIKAKEFAKDSVHYPYRRRIDPPAGRNPVMSAPSSSPQADWQAFIDGPLYLSSRPPWHDDPAFSVILEQPGLRDCIGGPVAPALNMACDLVRALTQHDIMAQIRSQRPAQGLCLGIGMNATEPYDLLHALQLDCVHACEWIGEHIVEAAEMLQVLRSKEPDLPQRIRLHQASIRDLSFLPDASIQVVYTANMFTWEVPMQQQTFDLATQEMRRVLATGGLLFSKGSAGELEKRLAPYGRMLLPYPPVTVFQKIPDSPVASSA